MRSRVSDKYATLHYQRETLLRVCTTPAKKFAGILISCLSFLTVTHRVIESKTHVGRRNEITGANVGPRHPIFFEGCGIDRMGTETFSTYFSKSGVDAKIVE